MTQRAIPPVKNVEPLFNNARVAGVPGVDSKVLLIGRNCFLCDIRLNCLGRNMYSCQAYFTLWIGRNLVTQYLVKEVPGSKQGTRSSLVHRHPGLLPTSPQTQPRPTEEHSKSQQDGGSLKWWVFGGDSIGPNLFERVEIFKTGAGRHQTGGNSKGRQRTHHGSPVAKTPFPTQGPWFNPAQEVDPRSS